LMKVSNDIINKVKEEVVYDISSNHSNYWVGIRL
jgi:hypothetical protein